MSGHSKWAQIKRKKAKNDQQRGKLFSKLIREITTAARVGGGDPKGNMRLKAAIEEAKGVNMPADTLKRAIQKGTGELPGETYEEVTYEGYGPGGVALLIKTLTDNKKRTAPEIRHGFTQFGGNMADVGSVAWMFERKGLILVEASRVDEDELLTIALEGGATDMRRVDTLFEVSTEPAAARGRPADARGARRAGPVGRGDVRPAVDHPAGGQGSPAGPPAGRGHGRAGGRTEGVRELRHPRRGARNARSCVRAVGFDPGLAETGYAALAGGRPGPAVLGAGVIRTHAAEPLETRLEQLFEAIHGVLASFDPDVLVVEDVFAPPRSRAPRSSWATPGP